MRFNAIIVKVHRLNINNDIQFRPVCCLITNQFNWWFVDCSRRAGWLQIRHFHKTTWWSGMSFWTDVDLITPLRCSVGVTWMKCFLLCRLYNTRCCLRKRPCYLVIVRTQNKRCILNNRKNAPAWPAPRKVLSFDAGDHYDANTQVFRVKFVIVLLLNVLSFMCPPVAAG